MIARMNIYEGVWQCEWRNHEAIISKGPDGNWKGDLIAYGEHGALRAEEANAIAYAFGLADEIDSASEWTFDWWFAGNKMF